MSECLCEGTGACLTGNATSPCTASSTVLIRILLPQRLRPAFADSHLEAPGSFGLAVPVGVRSAAPWTLDVMCAAAARLTKVHFPLCHPPFPCHDVSLQLRITCHQVRSTREARPISPPASAAPGRSSAHRVSSQRLAGRSLQHTTLILVPCSTPSLITPAPVGRKLQAMSRPPRRLSSPLTHQPARCKTAVSPADGARLPSCLQKQLLLCGPCCARTCSHTTGQRTGRPSGGASSATCCTGTPGTLGIRPPRLCAT